MMMILIWLDILGTNLFKSDSAHSLPANEIVRFHAQKCTFVQNNLPNFVNVHMTDWCLQPWRLLIVSNHSQTVAFFHQESTYTSLLHHLPNFYGCNLWIWLNAYVQIWLTCVGGTYKKSENSGWNTYNLHSYCTLKIGIREKIMSNVLDWLRKCFC